MQQPKLYFWDKLLGHTVFKLIPDLVKPNHITIFRLVLIPAILYLLWFEQYSGALCLFLFAAFTDTLDGSLARVRNQITEWGKIYDPLADKLLICFVILFLIIKFGNIWAATVVVILEFLIIISAMVKKWRGTEIQANIWGKIKMNLQVAGIVILFLSIILHREFLIDFSSDVFYLAIAFAVLSLFTYSI